MDAGLRKCKTNIGIRGDFEGTALFSSCLHTMETIYVGEVSESNHQQTKHIGYSARWAINITVNMYLSSKIHSVRWWTYLESSDQPVGAPTVVAVISQVLLNR